MFLKNAVYLQISFSPKDGDSSSSKTPVPTSNQDYMVSQPRTNKLNQKIIKEFKAVVILIFALGLQNRG
jgi:hypothetical protein